MHVGGDDERVLHDELHHRLRLGLDLVVLQKIKYQLIFFKKI